MKVAFNVLDRQFMMHKEEYEAKALEVLRSGWYILGKEVEAFETEFAKYLGSRHCVGLASGLDAIVLAFRALDIKAGDEVIVAGNAYIACVMGISMNNAVPVFCEPDEYYNIDASKIESLITSKTKAILAVHLYGQPCDMKSIKQICDKHKLYLVEDCAQSHGSTYDGIMTGRFSDIGCFSFYPSKNLGAFGDAGAIVTDNSELADKIRVLRNYGSEKRYYNEVVGYNSRLDELQAGLLRVKLKYLDELNKERIDIAKRYLREVDNPKIILPKILDKAMPIWHLFVVRVKDRAEFMSYLNECNIGSVIHYPIPPHLSKAYEYLGYKEGDYPITESYANEVVSLPIYNGMTKEEVDYTIKCLNKY